jgi:PIN domain nuclease of toxin-antitoxin system
MSVADAVMHFERAGFELLEREHILAVATLPPLHGDPIERLLVAQAISEPLRFVTRDKVLANYSDTIIVG